MQHRYNLGVALVLLAVCLVWACNQQLPTAPEDPAAPLAVNSDTPGFSSNASAAPGSDIYSYTGSGDLTFPPDLPAYRGAGKKSSQVNLCAVGCDVLVVFSEGFVNHWAEDWRDCFGDATGSGVPLFAGILRPDKKNPNGVRAQFWFQGKGTGGVKDFTYQLAATGVTSDTFPPAPEDPPAMIEWEGASGVMLTEGKGRGSKGRNAGAACTGDVKLSTSIILEGVP